MSTVLVLDTISQAERAKKIDPTFWFAKCCCMTKSGGGAIYISVPLQNSGGRVHTYISRSFI